LVRLGQRPISAPRRADIRRPDQFDENDRRHARHSVNLFGWRPTAQRGRAELRAVVEAIDETGTTVRTFESPIQRLAYWHDSPVLSFDYHFLKVDGCAPPEYRPDCEDWREGVPTPARALGHALAAEGAVFTTQNFPVVETRGRPREDLSISVPVQVVAMRACQDWRGWEKYHCYNPGTPVQQAVHKHVGSQLYAAGLNSSADVLVGLVPPGFASNWAGVRIAWTEAPGKRVILAEVNKINPVGVAHEFGHFFDLDHCPEDPDKPSKEDEECLPPRIVGFRLSPSGASGFNKQDAEGNQEAKELLPVMHFEQQAVPSAFMGAADYGVLFQRIASAPRRQAGAASPIDLRRPWLALARLFFPRPVFAQSVDVATDGHLLVSGTVASDRVVLHRVKHRPGIARIPGTSGRMRLDLMDVAGRLLRSVPFDTVVADPWHEAPGGPAAFSVEVGAPIGLHAVRVTAPGGLSTEHRRSASPPSIRAEVNSPRGALARTLRWSVQDPDGDDVRVDVYVRADDEGPWRGIAIDTDRTALSVDAGMLPAGRQVAARLVASDGFNTTMTDIALGPGTPLTVLASLPAADASDVATSTDIIVFLSAPLRIGSSAPVVDVDAAQLRLTGPDGQTVFADVAYRRNVGSLILTPVQPLQPGARYTATLAAGLEESWGGKLLNDVTWNFVTALD